MGFVSRTDAAFAALLSLAGVGIMYANTQDSSIDASAAAIPLILLVTVPLLGRSSAPVGALGAALAGLVLHDLVFGKDVVRCGVVLPTTFLLVFSAALRLPRREALIGLGIGCGSVLAECITFFGPGGAFFVALTAAIWGIGRIARSRTEMARELEQRTTELREARDERARMEVAAERARLSSELDELLQRRLGALGRLAEARPEDASAAAGTLAEIERESRQTLEEMRAVVGVLRSDEAAAETEPQPTLAHLEALLLRAKGTDARLEVVGNPRVLPAAVELSAYRIVEHLLDALEDAGDVEVRVDFGDDALEVAVSGPARRRAESAIDRARERARLQRGTIDATVRNGRTEARVALPLAAAV